MIKYILFDVDNTILDFDACSEEAIIQGCKEFGIEYSRQLLYDFIEITGKLWKNYEKGVMTIEEISKTRFKTIFESHNINADGELFGKFYEKYIYSCAIPVDHSVEILEYLSKKYKLYIASNANENQQRNRIGIANMTKYFTDFFTSEKIGFSKPQTEFFDTCLKLIGDIEKDEVIMIGDSLRADIKGGIDAGISTCWYNRNGQQKCKGTVPTYTIYSLEEIKEIL